MRHWYFAESLFSTLIFIDPLFFHRISFPFCFPFLEEDLLFEAYSRSIDVSSSKNANFFYHSFIDIVISSSYFQGDVSVFQYFSTRCFSCYRMLSCLSLQTSIKSRTNLYFMKINERWEEEDQNSRCVLTLFFQSWKPSRIGKEEKEK